jgi:uncharacterized protein (UPF0332 family)
MFYLAEAFLEGEGQSFSSHAAVIGAFGKEFARSGRVSAEFHRYLIKAQALRTTADYEAEPGLTEAEVQVQMERAEEFLQFAGDRLS